MKPILFNQSICRKTILFFSVLFFSFVAFAQPANDNCVNATTRTSGLSCNNTQYRLRNATASAGIPVGCAAGGTHYDVWFRFVAVSTTQTVTISGLESNFTNPEIQLFGGTCGALTSIVCGTLTMTGTALSVGNTYYVRVSNIGTLITSLDRFNICVTHPPPPPANDNCSGATALTSTPTPTCSSIAGNLQYATNSAPTGTCGSATATTTFDVWYSFVASSATHAVTISNLGTGLLAASTYMQLLGSSTNNCGGVLTSLACQPVSTTGGRITSATLTVGNTYYVRVYVTTSPTTANKDFNICLQGPPVNYLCANNISLTPGATCVNTAGTLDLSILVASGSSGCMAAGNYYDVWYRFVAASATQTITLSGVGTGITAPSIQIFTTCAAGGPIACASATTLTQVGLSIGTTYFVRIANLGANPSGTGGVASFNICITNVASPPGNDNCGGAILITSRPTCSNISGTLINATATAGLAACGNALSPEVWYRFVAQNSYPIITLSAVGASLAAANPRIQLFSGACGSLTAVSIPCVASPLNTFTNPGGTGLTIGTTYYVRITTTTLTAPVTTGTYTFNICITDPVPLPITVIDYAKSYVNITDGIVGGTINPGDVLEIRATFVVRGAAINVDSVAFYDTLRAGIGLTLNPNTIATRTNEGKVYQSFTDNAADADAGWTAPAGPDASIQINMGPTATRTIRGALNGNSLPTFYSNCIVMATYRVTVSGGYGTKINYGGGAFVYRDAANGSGIKINFPNDSLMVYESPGICPNSVAQTNILGDEFSGTFGAPPASAASQNRGASPNTTYSYQAFNPGGPGDYFYAVANNTSANNSIVQTVPKQSASGVRVFQVWDISGDHTGAADVAKGNTPCNPGLPISATNPCGYMLVVNAAFRTDVAFNFTVTGACPNTYYEISSWVKNICYKCSGDVNGRNASDPAGPPFYIPTVAGPAGFADSSGVRPNLAYEINGVDYYTTGDIVYQGLGIGGTQTGSDTLNRWLRKSFVYRTGPSETGFVLTIRNNAPGGGGNDWALDDITLRTCYPNMSYSPSVTPTVCANSTITIRDTVRSYYNTYIEYKWQRSTDGGSNWVDIAGTTATATPVVVNGMYQFIATYTVPPVFTTLANTGDLYRVVVATTVANLSGTCNYSDVIPVALTINNCVDIDDDNDGIPDYVEFNNPLALAGGATPNWNNPAYPGYIDTNADGVNDNFDYGADANNNGIPNYMDPTFTPWVDSNSDGVNDLSDIDLDGIPNQLDLDSDNDGIPDVAESYGVDTDGNGRIDNYSDTDNDGLSQNVDGSGGGVTGSGNGLGAIDFDGDGIPNYLDTDSDNDGIPDLIEVAGADTNNNGLIDSFTDANFDGFSDNDTTTNALLRTGTDVTPLDGRADNWPNKNMDRDFRPNVYDVDSDGDGIVDVIEAGLPDANLNGIVDGVIGTNGWSTTVSGFASLNLRTTDGDGRPDYLDIDSDGDGIPDNIEGQSTAGYLLPTLSDADGDGLTLPYDNVPAGFSGGGIFVYDHDADLIPDYRDLDSDADGLGDIVEGNDFNLNGRPDDNVTPTGLDTDGDGLDNRFDSLNSVTNIKGTSYRMGSGGTFTGDAAPGSRTTVQRTMLTQPDRDWRFVGYVLPVQFLNFTGTQNNNNVLLNWTIIADKEIERFEIERSTTNTNYVKIKTVTDPVLLHLQQSFSTNDDISNISSEIIYYRLKVIGKAGEIKYSNVIFVRKKQTQIPVSIMPNPANGYVNINLYADKNTDATIILIDKVGKRVLVQNEKLTKGPNSINLILDKFSAGVYAIVIETTSEKIVKQLIIVR